MGLVDSALSFIDKSSDFEKSIDLLSEFTGLVHAFGLKHFIMAGLPSYGEDVEQLVVANGWPPEWMERYREQSYFLRDPVSLWAFKTGRAYRWSEARARTEPTKISQTIQSEASGFDLVDGFVVPMFDPSNWQAVVSFSADQTIDLSQRDQAMLQIAATICHGQAMNLVSASTPSVPELTPREKDILTWMAHGKTRWETAEILRLSENTVKQHIANILAKLKVSNTVQAVARALCTRQISP